MASSALTFPRGAAAKSVAELGQVQDRAHDAIAGKLNQALQPLQGIQWIQPTLINGWANFSAANGQFTLARIGKDAFGWAFADGLVKGGTIGFSVADAILILPAGYRPKQGTILTGDANGGFAEFRINSYGTGEIVCTVGGSSAYVSLAGLRWPAEI